jgi:alkanesulfonate monooxygenase SsuD/methylene tetrahydromethanopterin reductase-like flavin-dependent oxidoreductase (luciferase family)
VSSSNVPVPSQTPETEEQKRARLESEREEAQRQLQRDKEREEAQRKAKELLRGILDKKQLEQFNKTKWFFVVGESGKRYRIRHGWVGNVDEINQDDMVVATYCIHPQIRVPIEDSMAIQKLMLEANESMFKQVANRDLLRTPRPLAV